MNLDNSNNMSENQIKINIYDDKKSIPEPVEQNNNNNNNNITEISTPIIDGCVNFPKLNKDNPINNFSASSSEICTTESSLTEGSEKSYEEHLSNTNKEKIYQGYRTYKDVVKLMSEKFNTQDNINSTALDIISVYLKGQKIIQIESKIYCEYYLYRLMLPAIFISTISSVISGIFKDFSNASIAVCLLTAMNTFILSLVTYLKLDAKAEAHKTSAYSYDKLQTMCEFSSGRILLNTTTIDDVNHRTMGNLLDDIENKVMEIKEKNQFIIPSYIRVNYPKLYYTNIFSVVKQIQNEEIIYTNQLKVIMNKGADIVNEINKGNVTQELLERKKQQYIEKNNAIDNLIRFREKYYELDREFKKEIESNILRKKKNIFSTSCCCKYSNSCYTLPVYQLSNSALNNNTSSPLSLLTNKLNSPRKSIFDF